jgi:hypothetical protein
MGGCVFSALMREIFVKLAGLVIKNGVVENTTPFFHDLTSKHHYSLSFFPLSLYIFDSK